MNRSETITACRHWSDEIHRAASIVEESGDGSPYALQVIDGNRAIGDTLKRAAELLELSIDPDDLSNDGPTFRTESAVVQYVTRDGRILSERPSFHLPQKGDQVEPWDGWCSKLKELAR